MSITHAIGRRKTSVARIFVKEGKGIITVNNRDYKSYFNTSILHYKVTQSLKVTETLGSYDINVNIRGGGITGQAEAIRLAISRALCNINPDSRALLKPKDLLTRDSRMAERKKYGQKKARKKFQFSKR